MHTALVEEIESMKQQLSDGSIQEDRKMHWEKAFTNCFLKVDDEVGGNVSRVSVEGVAEPVASETVGSTAVVAVVSSSHIIVANCGDSRAVLCRGKEPMPLSVDHKVKLMFIIWCMSFVNELELHGSLILLYTSCSQIEKMNMLGLKLLEAKSFSGMGTVCLGYLQCQGPLVCIFLPTGILLVFSTS